MAACEGTAGTCDHFENVAMESCIELDDDGVDNAISLRIFKTTDFMSKNKCKGAPGPSPSPGPKPVPGKAKKSSNMGVIVGGAVAAAAVFIAVVIVVVQRSRAKKTAAYAVLSGSEYVN
jgi:hypothetical protein